MNINQSPGGTLEGMKQSAREKWAAFKAKFEEFKQKIESALEGAKDPDELIALGKELQAQGEAMKAEQESMEAEGEEAVEDAPAAMSPEELEEAVKSYLVEEPAETSFTESSPAEGAEDNDITPSAEGVEAEAAAEEMEDAQPLSEAEVGPEGLEDTESASEKKGEAGPMSDESIKVLQALEFYHPGFTNADGNRESIKELLANPEMRPSKEYASILIKNAIIDRNKLPLEGIRSLINDLEYDGVRIKEGAVEAAKDLYSIDRDDTLPAILEMVGINSREFATEQLPNVFNSLKGADDIRNKLEKFQTWCDVFGIEKTDQNYIDTAYKVWREDALEHGRSSFDDEALKQLFLGENGWIWNE